jgi:hypothetical protein
VNLKSVALFDGVLMREHQGRSAGGKKRCEDGPTASPTPALLSTSLSKSSGLANMTTARLAKLTM